MKKRKKIRFKIGIAKNKNKEKNEEKNKNIRIYSYKIGNKNIKLTVEKREVVKKSDLVDSVFYYNCEFCNKDFDPGIQTCTVCGRALTRINLKKCQLCGAKNNPAKQNCWVCNGPFPELEEKIEKGSEVVLTLDINNHFYRNTDKVLDLGMRKLFDDLVSTNFSREPLEAWVKLYENEVEFRKEFAKEECRNLAKESRRKSIVYMFFAILLPIFILAMLSLIFWAK